VSSVDSEEGLVITTGTDELNGTTETRRLKGD